MEHNALHPISLTEAARLLAVSPRTVRRLIDSGELTAIRIGSTLALPPEALPAPLRRDGAGSRSQPLLTLHDVAARLGCSPRRVRKLAASGVLPPVTIGGSARWLPSAVDALARRGGDDAE